MEHSLVNDELSLFSFEILALVGRDGAGPHDLLRLARRGRMLAWAGESRYYTEPKRLAALGYLEARKEPGRTKERTVYVLTDAGRAALVAHAREPVRVDPVKSDALLRLLMCDLVGEELTRESLGTLRDDVADLRRRLGESEEAASALPHREKYLRLVNRHLNRLLDLHLELVDEVERELVDEPDAGKRQRTREPSPRTTSHVPPNSSTF
jgi:DNA-binding PadR family transcriptional regulator